jgi:isopropylmalate/homocitrate/citramalate synthase
VILANVEERTQRFVPNSDNSDGISALTVSSDRHVFAVAKSNIKPTINVYDLHSFRRRRQLLPIEASSSKVIRK